MVEFCVKFKWSERRERKHLVDNACVHSFNVDGAFTLQDFSKSSWYENIFIRM